MTVSQTSTADLHCLRCAYNLHGLEGDGNCPECGLAIAVSTQHSTLRGSGVANLKKLRGAMLFLIVGAGISTVMDVLGWLTPDMLDSFGVRVGLALFTLPLYVGTWRLTIRPPGSVEPNRSRRLRWLIRLGAIVIALFQIAQFSTATMRFSFGEQRIIMVANFCVACLYFAEPIFIQIYLAMLAKRLPNVRLAKYALLLALLNGCVGGAKAGLQAMIYIGIVLSFDWDRIFDIYSAAGWVLMPLSVLIQLGSIPLLGGFRRKLREQIRERESSDIPTNAASTT